MTRRDYPPHVSITTSFTTPVFTSLTIPGAGFEVNNTITKDSLIDITLSVDIIGFDIRLIPSERTHNKTVVVRSSENVVVHVIDNDFGGRGGFVVIPATYLGTKHYVASYRASSFPSPSLCISALYSDTSIYIENENEHECFETIDQYESLRFDRLYDLSGTLVQSNKPVVLVSASNDFLAQVPSTTFWSTNYTLVPFPSINSGYVFRVFTMNSTATLLFNSGERIEAETFYDVDITENRAISFSSDQPVLVTQYLKGHCPAWGGCRIRSMLIVPPVSSFRNNITFSVYQYTEAHTYYITVIAECDTINDLTLDGEVTIWDVRPLIDQTLRYASLEVSPGLHTVSHHNPSVAFYVSVTAICRPNGCQSSYAYPAATYFGQSKYHLIKCMVLFFKL